MHDSTYDSNKDRHEINNIKLNPKSLFIFIKAVFFEFYFILGINIFI